MSVGGRYRRIRQADARAAYRVRRRGGHGPPSAVAGTQRRRGAARSWLMVVGVIATVFVLVVGWPLNGGQPWSGVSGAENTGTSDPSGQDAQATASALPIPSHGPTDPSPSNGGLDEPRRSTPQRATANVRPQDVSVPERGSGQLQVVPGRSGPRGGTSADYRQVTYRVEIESDVPFDRQQLAAAVHSRLTDAQGWQQLAKVTFERVDAGPVDVRVIVATPGTTDRLCEPLDTDGRFSCRVNDRVVLNARRWAEGAPAYGQAIDEYRAYMINHEMGHALGNGHASCEEPGAPAPVMMQQTKGLGECVANPWPTVHAL